MQLFKTIFAAYGFVFLRLKFYLTTLRFILNIMYFNGRNVIVWQKIGDFSKLN